MAPSSLPQPVRCVAAALDTCPGGEAGGGRPLPRAPGRRGDRVAGGTRRSRRLAVASSPRAPRPAPQVLGAASGGQAGWTRLRPACAPPEGPQVGVVVPGRFPPLSPPSAAPPTPGLYSRSRRELPRAAAAASLGRVPGDPGGRAGAAVPAALPPPRSRASKARGRAGGRKGCRAQEAGLPSGPSAEPRPRPALPAFPRPALPAYPSPRTPAPRRRRGSLGLQNNKASLPETPPSTPPAADPRGPPPRRPAERARRWPRCWPGRRWPRC